MTVNSAGNLPASDSDCRSTGRGGTGHGRRDRCPQPQWPAAIPLGNDARLRDRVQAIDGWWSASFPAAGASSRTRPAIYAG